MKKYYTILFVTITSLLVSWCSRTTFSKLEKEYPVCTNLFVKVYENSLNCYKSNTWTNADSICNYVNTTWDLEMLTSKTCSWFFQKIKWEKCLSKKEETDDIKTIECLFDSIGYTPQSEIIK